MGPFLFPWGAPHIDARPCIAHATLTALVMKVDVEKVSDDGEPLLSIEKLAV